MESIYRRHYHRITTIFALILMGLYSSAISAQITESFKEEISSFIRKEYPYLLKKSSEYSSLKSPEQDLRSSILKEMINIKLPINSNTVVEYAITSNQNEEVIISDDILSFLINYTGKKFDEPTLNFECLIKEEDNLIAYFKSSNEVSSTPTIRKMLFRMSDEQIELRRISFSKGLPNVCTGGEIVNENNSELIAQERESPTVESIAEKLVKPSIIESNIPQIAVNEARLANGKVYVYGFIKNHKYAGLLTNLENGQSIKVSSRDGFFAYETDMTANGYKDLNLRYDYNSKFIKNRLLVFIKSE